MAMEVSKVLRLPQKMQRVFWKRCKSIAPATQNDFRHGTKHVWMSRSATPAMRNEATRHLKAPKVTTFTELTIGTAIWPSHGRPRTVADGCATSGEHSLNPQTPRVKKGTLATRSGNAWKSWKKHCSHGSEASESAARRSSACSCRASILRSSVKIRSFRICSVQFLRV